MRAAGIAEGVKEETNDGFFLRPRSGSTRSQNSQGAVTSKVMSRPFSYFGERIMSQRMAFLAGVSAVLCLYAVTARAAAGTPGGGAAQAAAAARTLHVSLTPLAAVDAQRQF